MDDECMMTVMMMMVVVMYSLLPQTSPILASAGGSSCKWHYKTQNKRGEKKSTSKCRFTVVRGQIVLVEDITVRSFFFVEVFVKLRIAIFLRSVRKIAKSNC